MIVTLLVVWNVVFLSSLRVFAQPQPPCIFYGYVTAAENPATDGLNVTATIRGTGLKWTTQTKSGTYGWPVKGSSLLAIPSDNPDTPERDGGVTGDTVEFYVNGTKTGQTAIFESASAKQFDLSISAPVLEQSTLTVSLDCSAAFVGYKVKISGKLAYPNGNGISGASLLATYTVTGEQSWNNMASFNTTINGDYYAEWMPTTIGSYSIKVNWEGNGNVEGAEAYANLAVTPLEEKYVFSVISNSTISDLTYNATSKALGFTLNGPSGTTGYANVTIAKDLIADANGMKVYLDGNQIDHTTTANDASWLLHFTYQHSTHEAIVDLGLSTQPFFETPLGIATAFVIIAILIVMIYMGHKRLRRPEKTKLKSGLKSSTRIHQVQ